MDKMKKWNSLKWRMLLYMPIPLILAVVGTYIIGLGSNDLQELYSQHFFRDFDKDAFETAAKEVFESYVIEYDSQNPNIEKGIRYKDKDGEEHFIPFENDAIPMGTMEKIGYYIVSDAQMILIPLWIFLCIAAGGYIFYKIEIEKGILALLEASKKIAANELEFEMPKLKENELGMVGDSFESMRKSLLNTSLQNVRIIEETRRLNAAFSHDIRTPITVMKGYVELLEKYIPEGKVSKEKETEILGLMETQVSRLENYAISMNSIQKLEDLTPNMNLEDFSQMVLELENICAFIDSRVVFVCSGETKNQIVIDKELFYEAIENLVSNASRYARNKIAVEIKCDDKMLYVTVWDDGNGFSDKVIKLFGKPFLREDKEVDKNHFGLGIYISKLICEKCGGTLVIENREGAYAEASFKTSEE